VLLEGSFVNRKARLFGRRCHAILKTEPSRSLSLAYGDRDPFGLADREAYLTRRAGKSCCGAGRSPQRTGESVEGGREMA
jgi:hypothetical protein